MAQLPDPTSSLTADDRALYERMASVRAHAEGRSTLGEVYVRMFNNPGVAATVGALGEHLRFHGVLPDDLRELAILRYSSRSRFGYEWAHHQRPARIAGLSDEVIDQVTRGEVPGGIDGAARAVVEAVDAVIEHRSIPDHVQQRIVDSHGTAGAVEVVAICGLYAIMGYTVTAFDIAVEDGLPDPPF